MSQPGYKSTQQEQAFNRKYSRFKIVFFFKDKGKLTHYGHERSNCTVEQINFKHVHTIMLDRKKGFADCLTRLEWFAGKYVTAMIFDRKGSTTLPDGTVQKGCCVRKFVNGDLAESQEIDFTDSKQYFSVQHEGDTWKLSKCLYPEEIKKEVKTHLH